MPGKNTAFPLGLSSGISDKAAMYSSARQLLWIVMNWGTINTRPAFTNGPKGSLDISDDSSSIDYQGTKYDLFSATITAPSHTTWILPAVNSDRNLLDVFIVFKSEESTSDTKYIFVVLPLLRNESVKDPAYIAGLTDAKEKGPFSLKDVLPLNGKRDFAFYSTHFTSTESALSTTCLTLIFYNGVGVTPSTLQSLVDKKFPAITLPTELGGFTAGTIDSATNFPTSASVSTYTTPLATRTDLTKAYKCVPLDPDVDIANGKIQFDPTSSKIVPLSEIIDQRDAVRLSEMVGAVKKTGSVEQVIAIFLGIFLALTCIGFLFFIIAQGMGWSTSLTLPTYLYVGVAACFGGYLLGILYHP